MSLIKNLVRAGTKIVSVTRDDFGTPWKETEHPRGPDGKFANVTSSQVAKPLKLSGFKKGKTNPNAFKHELTGAQVHVHPPNPGKQWSSKWTYTSPNGEKHHGHGGSIEQLLKSKGHLLPASETAAIKADLAKQFAPTAPTSAAKSNGDLGDILVKNGYSVHVLKGDHGVTFKKGSGEITYYTGGPFQGTWVSVNPGFSPKTGKGAETLQKLLEGKAGLGTLWQNITAEQSQALASGDPDKANAELAEKQAAAAKAHAEQQKKDQEHVELYKKLYKDKPAPKSSTQAVAIQSYKGSGYTSINDCLRYQENCGNAKVPHITSYLNEAKLKEPVTVYRGVGGEYAKILKSILKVGSEFVDRGFVSTSTSSNFAGSWASGALKFKINAPAGSLAAPIASHEHDSEYEVLFQRGATFKVTGIDKGTGVVHCDIITQEHAA